MGTTLSSLIKNNQIPATAGVAIAKNDLLEISPNGKVYPAQVVDYAVTPNKGTAILAATTLSMMTSQAVVADYYRLTAQDSTGNLYALTSESASSGASGLRLNKCTANGASQRYLTIDTTSNITGASISFLSNGNILCIYNLANSTNFAIIDPSLQVVKATTVVNGNTTAYPQGVGVPLLSTGFVIVHINGTDVEFALYDNLGNYVRAYTRAPLVGLTETLILYRLSNGNLLLREGSNYISIMTDTLTVVLAPTIQASFANPYGLVMPGYFLLHQSMVGSGTAGKAAVYNNSGVQQGSLITQTNYSFGNAVVNPGGTDGTYFYLFGWAAANTPRLARISNSGVITNYTLPTFVGATGSYSAAFDPILGVGIAALPTTSAFTASVQTIDLSDFTTTSFVTGTVSVGASSGGIVEMLAVGDGALFVLAQSNAAISCISVQKVVDTAIVGPAQAAAAIGGTVPVITASGYYQINRLKGSQGKAFTMRSGANLYGNDGSISGIGASLKGM